MNECIPVLKIVRLYAVQGADTESLVLAGEHGRVRALVLELSGQGGCSAIGRVWQGVQAELQLPAPALAVNGVDALQLWFSLAEPVPFTVAILIAKSFVLSCVI